jgi:Tfp pilus assembly protein PilV
MAYDRNKSPGVIEMRGFQGLKSKQKGMSLIEVGLAIVVALIVIAAASALFSTQREKAHVKAAVEGVNYMYQAAQDWASVRPNFTGVSCAVLTAQSLLPQILGDCTGDNPWGGNYTVAVNGTNAARVNITLTGVPNGPGAQLVDKLTPFASVTPTFASGTFTVTF